MAEPRRVVLFTRYPEPGRVKTRLIPVLGPEGAAELQRRMTERVLATLEGHAAEHGTEVEIRLDGGTPERAWNWLGPHRRVRPQSPGDLGARLHRAFEDSVMDGVRSTVIVGSDCPTIDASHLSRAFAALADGDLVLGPAEDGGYYLIGLRRPRPSLFIGMPWGTSEVLDETTRAAASAGLEPTLLPVLPDVDRPENLAGLPEDLRRDLAH